MVGICGNDCFLGVFVGERGVLGVCGINIAEAEHARSCGLGLECDYNHGSLRGSGLVDETQLPA